MKPLEQTIIQRIQKNGPITFETFMDIALYDPGYGYYASRGIRIGREGDFYTSSHLHPVFGAMIGKQVLEMWEVMGRPPEFTLVEMGAGEGYICKDLLDYLQRDSGDESARLKAKREFCESLRYVIAERNPLQRERQQEILKAHRQRLRWVNELKETGRFTGCIFSNELLDAFPVHLVRMEDELKEIMVACEGDALREQSGPLSTDGIARYFSRAGITLTPGYTTEVNLRIRDWLGEIDAVLERGFIFTIDYGYPAEEYYSDDRNRGTLMCYHRHQLIEDPYANIGEQDITAHVNFSSLKQWGEEKGIRTIGYCSQGSFLLAAGIDREIALLAESSKEYLYELGRIKKLFLPQGLGDSHKVMIQYKGSGDPELRGFSIRNQLKLL